MNDDKIFVMTGGALVHRFYRAKFAIYYPKWVKFGLIGGSIQELKRMGDEFCAEMEATV